MIRQKILDAIREATKRGYPPSIRELCAATGVNSPSSMLYHLRLMERDGLIRRTTGTARSIVLPDREDWRTRHWLIFGRSEDEGGNPNPVTGCHCGFVADESDCGWGDSVVDHIVTAALRENA